jgi:hypothetical protein
MRYEFQMTFEEFKAACTLSKQPGKTPQLVVVVVLIGVILLILDSMNLPAPIGRVIEGILLVLTIIMAAFIVLTVALRKVFLPRVWQRIYESLKEYKMPMTYEFTDGDFVVTTSGQEKRIPWQDFSDWKENEQFFLMRRANSAAAIVPKRIFAATQEADSLRAILTRALGQARR